MLKLKGIATGIGSLPHADAKSAVDLILRSCPQIPFWPQLPKLNSREGMVAQFSEGLPCIKVSDKGISLARSEEELERFYENIINPDNKSDNFKISEHFASGLYEFKRRLASLDRENILYLKGHITGPFTFAASIKDEAGKVLLHDPVFMQAIIKGLGAKALWQIDFFREFQKKMIIFIDEPYLGCFGSAYTPINREDVVRGLVELTDGFKSPDTLIGVHCCGNTDWSIFTDVPAIGMINFDAFNYLEKFVLYSDSLKGFLKKGGIICWGIVPTQEFTGKENPELLVRQLTQGIQFLVKKGLDRELLLNQLIVTPSCGLGTLETKKAEGILRLLSETSRHLNNI